MADNTELSAGSGGDVIASDDIGGIKHQRVKLSVGADGAASDAVPVSNGMDVTGAAVQAVGLVAQFDDVSVGTVTENQFAPVRISSRRALLVEGVASGTVLPVSDGGGSLTVDLASTTVTGTVAVTQSGTWDEVGINDSGNSITVDNPQLSVVGGGTEATALRVTLASDSTGVVSVDDNGGSLTVDGTVAATNAGTFAVQESGGALTALQVIDDWDESDRAKVNPIVGQAGIAAGAGAVGATVPRVTLASDDPAVVALQVLDNAIAGNEMQVDVVTLPNVTLAAGTNTNEVVGDAAHDAAVAGNPVLAGAEARITEGTAVSASGDVVRVAANSLGKLIVIQDAPAADTWSYAAASGGIVNTTGVTAKTATASKRHYVRAVQVINGHATVSTDVQIRDGASGTVMHRGFAQAAGGGYAMTFEPPLRFTSNTLIEVACGTSGSATYVNLQGYTSAE
jgi:hypothetical protein